MAWFPGSLRDVGSATPIDVAILDGAGNQLTGFDPSRPDTAARTNPAVTTTDSVILASNAARRKFLINNPNGKKLFVGFGAAATSSSYDLVVPANGSYDGDLNGFTGDIHAVWGTGTGSVLVTEVTKA